jgi:hypothetical protein
MGHLAFFRKSLAGIKHPHFLHVLSFGLNSGQSLQTANLPKACRFTSGLNNDMFFVIQPFEFSSSINNTRLYVA